VLQRCPYFDKDIHRFAILARLCCATDSLALLDRNRVYYNQRLMGGRQRYLYLYTDSGILGRDYSWPLLVP
jgi:hypothetical protein